jgi:CBS domain-containing protein
MRVEELMSEATCCRETDTVRACAKLMKDEDIGFAPICDTEGRPIGAVTDRDLVIRVIADGLSPDAPLSKVMSRDAIACQMGDGVEKAMELMRNERVSRVMVVDDQDKLKGVISLQDLAQASEEDEAGETLQEVKSDAPPSMH